MVAIRHSVCQQVKQTEQANMTSSLRIIHLFQTLSGLIIIHWTTWLLNLTGLKIQSMVLTFSLWYTFGCKCESHRTLQNQCKNSTRSSAIAEGPRDASCQWKYCQLPRNSAETTYTTSPDQIDGMKLEIQSEAMRDRQRALNHDAIESAPVVSDVINKPTTLSCVYRLYTDDLLWRNFLSPQCTNCSRDPDHAHLGSTHSSQD